MAAQLIDCLWVSAYGSQLASGTIRFFEPSTLTPLTVYGDDAATVVLTQPIALDATGRTVSPVYTTAPARAILNNASGAQVLDVERINGVRGESVTVMNSGWPGAATLDNVLSLLYTNAGGLNGRYLAPGAGAVARVMESKLAEQPTPQDYGAFANGISNDAAAITSALTYLSGLGGGVLYLPAGRYLIGSSITVPSNVVIRGAGANASVIVNGSAGQDALKITSVSRVVLEDVGIEASAPTTNFGVSVTSSSYVVLSRVRVQNHSNPLAFGDNGVTATQFNKVQYCELISEGGAGDSSILITGTVATTGSFVILGNTLTGKSGGAGTSTLLKIDGTTSTVAVVGNFQPNPQQSYGARIVSSHTGSKLTFFGNDFGGCTAAGLAIQRATGPQLMEFANIWGTVVDSSDGNQNLITSPYYGLGTPPVRPTGTAFSTTTFNGSGAVTPDLKKANVYEIIENTAATTVTINAPANNMLPTGGELVFRCKNASAGAVTWTFNAVFITSAAVAPGAGQRTNIVFRSNATAWEEFSRATF